MIKAAEQIPTVLCNDEHPCVAPKEEGVHGDVWLFIALCVLSLIAVVFRREE